MRHVRRERWLGALYILLMWAALPALIAFAASVGTVCVAPIVMLFLTALLLGRSHGAPIAGVRVPGRPGVVMLDGEGLTIELTKRDHRRFRRDAILAGWTERFRTGQDDVVLQLRSGEIVRFRVADADEAHAVLQAAGVAPEQRAVTLRLGVAEETSTRVLLIFLTLVVSGFSLAAVAGTLFVAAKTIRDQPLAASFTVAVPVALAVVAYVILLRPLVTATLRIGTDGIALERLFRRRFLPRTSFRTVTAEDKQLTLTAANLPPVTLTVSSPEEASTVALRIAEAMAERSSAAAQAVQARLDRHGRPITSWLQEVRAAARANSAYREAALERDDLTAVLEDGAAPAERRIAAAAALASDEEGKKRVRIAAEACADERLRIALEAATEDEAELEEARIEEALRARG